MQGPVPGQIPRRAGIGQKYFLLEARPAHELHQGARRTHGVGPVLQEEAVGARGPDDASDSIRRFEEANVVSRLREGLRRREPGDAASDDKRPHVRRERGAAQNAVCARMMSSSAARNVGSSFKPGVRRKCAIPAARAASPKSWSTS